MKKTVYLSLAVAVSLMAGDIDISKVPSSPTRMDVSNTNLVLSYHNAIKDVKKSVVNISTSKKNVQSQQLKEMLRNPYFRDFFGNILPEDIPNSKQNSLGSGVIISKDGYVVTNDHVVEDADEILVSIQGDEKEYKAKVIGRDPKTDIAVIKIDAKELHVASFADSSTLQEGDIVFAIGNPFGVGSSVTQGIISALNKNNMGLTQYENFIQTDASINPGNSGGALVDSRGALIGINSAILSRSGGNNGIGFAIPSNMVEKVAVSLIKYGKIERGFLGVSISDLTKDFKELYENKNGALIAEVEKGSSAEKAGLQRGDLVIEIDGKKIKDSVELKDTVGSIPPGKTISITYERNKKIKKTDAKLDKMSAPEEMSGENAYIEGLSVKNIDEKTKLKNRLHQDAYGVLVTEIKRGSVAEKMGLRVGDIILQVEDITIDSVKDLTKALKEHKGNKKRVYALRDGFPLLLVAP
ncbi:MAG: Do family serine endopeptidase [Sulfurospirillaceae bacterium]|nr:Do family serine endopeptidase [Sulfurospirillaceae bacterium]MDD3463636.1 Do family serine endopeptidase [Sulfurospirillaceae bacterium]